VDPVFRQDPGNVPYEWEHVETQTTADGVFANLCSRRAVRLGPVQTFTRRSIRPTWQRITMVDWRELPDHAHNIIRCAGRAWAGRAGAGRCDQPRRTAGAIRVTVSLAMTRRRR
jgi:hypothetical protein